MTIATPTIDIEQALIWTYRLQQADLRQQMGVGPQPQFDSCALVARSLSTAVSVGADCHPDADLLHGFVLGLSRYQAVLVICHAKAADRPDWLPGAKLVIAAEVNLRGNPRRIYDENRNLIGHRVRQAVELGDGTLMLGWDLDVVEAERNTYRLWHQALVDLSRRLGTIRVDGKLAIGPEAPATPWKEGLTTRPTKSY